MTALDTNLLVRLIILQDEPEQSARAEALIFGGPCLVGETVLLELSWVLRTTGGMSRLDVVQSLRALLDIPTLGVADEPAIRQALDDAEAGLDLADAFHRAFAGAATRLATFDRRFARAAEGRPGLPVDLL